MFNEFCHWQYVLGQATQYSRAEQSLRAKDVYTRIPERFLPSLDVLVRAFANPTLLNVRKETNKFIAVKEII